ncbi:hypothetical protein [Bacillus sp. AFS040349]|uniref:hypothetical protein n=1 Tax=Bacillus sp. AFS040349 TaxID=2033502 RepID=UPI000BFEA1D5|nr:hypothetical protein [Bacillus sp. AFS040349]PGT81579.1 hypothetical protein COD11_17310 [Bacillus sp. AFS040349]
MFKVKETRKTKQLELVNESGEVVQKACKTCQQVKLIEDFPKYTQGGFRPSCKPCYKKIQDEYNKSIKDKRRAYKQVQRARAVGAPDAYSEEDWKALKKHAQGKCMISGKEAELQAEHVQALSKKWLGSSKGNIILVSEEVNQAKRDMSLFEFLQSPRSNGLVDFDRLKDTLEYLAEANGMSLSRYLQFLQDAEELAQKNKEFWG